jgi:glutamine synthetase adenylyltransferase
MRAHEHEVSLEEAERLHQERVAALVEQHLQESAAPATRTLPSPRRHSWLLPCMVSIVSTAIIGLQTPALLDMLKERPPLRNGTAATDAFTDACINQLWTISSLRQQEQTFTHIVEPLSQKPYVTKTIQGETIVECPTPALHGVTALRISDNAPVPEVIK